MSKKRRHRKSCCCYDPCDPSNAYSMDPCVFNALQQTQQQNQQIFFLLLLYTLCTNNTINCNILSKHDKLENYLICSHELLLRNAINN